MTGELSYIVSTFVSVFVIVDPFAVMPVYILLTERFSEKERRATRRKASLVALTVLLVFAFTGLTFFNFFGITLPAFQIAGGILLLLLGIQQLNANRMRVKEEEKDESLARDDISIFPLATPLLAGPGAISTVVLFASHAGSKVRMLGLATAILGAIIASHLCLKGSGYFYRILGKTGLNLITRLMGLILTAVAIQFILNGVKGAIAAMKGVV